MGSELTALKQFFEDLPKLAKELPFDLFSDTPLAESGKGEIVEIAGFKIVKLGSLTQAEDHVWAEYQDVVKDWDNIGKAQWNCIVNAAATLLIKLRCNHSWTLAQTYALSTVDAAALSSFFFSERNGWADAAGVAIANEENAEPEAETTTAKKRTPKGGLKFSGDLTVTSPETTDSPTENSVDAA